MRRTRSHKIVSPRIVPGDARPNPWLWILTLIALGLWTWQVYDYGGTHAERYAAGRIEREAALRERIAELERERDELRFQSARHERGSQIDRQAALAIRDDIEALQKARSDLEREAAALRAMVADGGDRLEIRDYVLRGNPDDGGYRYQMSVVRLVEGTNKLEGSLTLRIAGEAGGEPTELSLAEVSDGPPVVHRLGFRQYQRIEGDLILPSDFVPSRLMIDVTPAGTQFRPLTVAYDWAPTPD